MNTLERLLVDRKELRKMGITLSFAEIDRRERNGKWPRRIKAGNHRNSRVYYRYKDLIELIEEWATGTPRFTDDESPQDETSSDDVL
jgi:hypothetical protein